MEAAPAHHAYQRHAVGLLSLLAVAAMVPTPTTAGAVTLNGITFSDELGGFELIGGSGSGSKEDPFIIVERIYQSKPAVLTIRGMATALALRKFSFHFSGFSLIKVVINATLDDWQNFGLALETPLGTASTYLDGLSFGQAIPKNRPITSDVFANTIVVDEPDDSVIFDNGSVPPGTKVLFKLLITDHSPREVFFLRQWREEHIAQAPRGRGLSEDGQGPDGVRVLELAAQDGILELAGEMRR